MHDPRDNEYRRVLDPADPRDSVHRRLRGEEILGLERDAPSAEDSLLLVIPGLRSDRDGLLAVLNDVPEVRVGRGDPERHRANPSADIDNDRVLRKAIPRERCAGIQRT